MLFRSGRGNRPSRSQVQARSARLTTPHCGRLICRAERAWTCDLLGLFPLPIPTGRPAAVLILPPDMEQALPERLLGGGPGGGALLPRPGGGPGEDYDLRDYRPGDPLRSVHWKLSSKRDELVVRETLEPRQTTLVLTYDHFGAPAALDQTFARLCALSRALLERGRPHHIQWASPSTPPPVGLAHWIWWGLPRSSRAREIGRASCRERV